MEKVSILLAIWNVTAISYILWPLGNLVTFGHIYPHFGLLCQKNWQP
jgi:hypothetical protein